MLVPEGGFGDRLNAMHDWHMPTVLKPCAAKAGVRNGRDIIRWCFADLVTAALFEKEFGAEANHVGQRTNQCSKPLPPRLSVGWMMPPDR